MENETLMENIGNIRNYTPNLIKEGLEPLLEELKTSLEEKEEILGIVPMASRAETFLIFTYLRIIYFNVPEFNINRRFYSYPYETVKSLMIKERASPLSEPKDELWFLIDYTSGEIIFADVFPPESIDYIKEQIREIPAFGEIPVTNKVYGSRKFSRIVNNPELALSNKKNRNIVVVLIAILLIAALIGRSL